ncbi:MAG: TlpA family protein disulfide reductase [Deltaproteobacteria bacterium]|nr:TlpA family protein disulfide reductase [Deltaproteobacteria bacterium]
MLNSKPKNFFIKAAVAVASVALLLIAGLGAKTSAPERTIEPRGQTLDFLTRELNAEPPARNDGFPHALLKDLTGNPFKLNGQGGKIILVSFWASWCPACNQELPLLQSLYTKLGPEGLLFVGANFQEDAQTVERYLQAHGYTFPVVMDTKGEAFDRLQAAFLPTTFILTENGDLRGKIVGHRDWQSKRIRNALQQALRDPA